MLRGHVRSLDWLSDLGKGLRMLEHSLVKILEISRLWFGQMTLMDRQPSSELQNTQRNTRVLPTTFPYFCIFLPRDGSRGCSSTSGFSTSLIMAPVPTPEATKIRDLLILDNKPGDCVLRDWIIIETEEQFCLSLQWRLQWRTPRQPRNCMATWDGKKPRLKKFQGEKEWLQVPKQTHPMQWTTVHRHPANSAVGGTATAQIPGCLISGRSLSLVESLRPKSSWPA